METEEKTISILEEPRRVSKDEWLREGAAKFGDDPRDWQFVCPNCKHIQTIGDFIRLRAAGEFEGSPEVAYYACMGRYDKRIPEGKVGTLGDPKEYCDYTLGGFFPLTKTVVIDDEGKEKRVFEFAEPEEAKDEIPG